MEQSLQSNEQKSLDTRTFQEIFSAANPDERFQLKLRIRTAIQCSERAIYYWSLGEHYPAVKPVRKEVSNVVNRVLHIRTTPLTLFPYNK